MRREKDVPILTEGRDYGKRFQLIEMPAMQAAKWADRFFLAAGRSGVYLPPGLEDQGMAGVAMVALRTLGGMEWGLVEPLLDEMFECVKIYPPNAEVAPRKPIGEDIEEVATIWFLRQEVLELHLGFSVTEVLSKFQGTMTTTSES